MKTPVCVNFTCLYVSVFFLYVKYIVTVPKKQISTENMRWSNRILPCEGGNNYIFVTFIKLII